MDRLRGGRAMVRRHLPLAVSGTESSILVILRERFRLRPAASLKGHFIDRACFRRKNVNIERR